MANKKTKVVGRTGRATAAQVAFGDRAVVTYDLQAFDTSKGVAFCGGPNDDGVDVFVRKATREAKRILVDPYSDGFLIDYAKQVLFRCERIKELLESNEPRQAVITALQLGMNLQWMWVCSDEWFVRQGQLSLYIWRGIPCPITETKSSILSYMERKSEVPVVALVRKCWGERYTARHRNKVNKALSVLSSKFADNKPPIPITLSLDGDRVLKSLPPPASR